MSRAKKDTILSEPQQLNGRVQIHLTTLKEGKKPNWAKPISAREENTAHRAKQRAPSLYIQNEQEVMWEYRISEEDRYKRYQPAREESDRYIIYQQ